MSMVASKHDLENKDAIKPKRFKVGKACYTCRLKKIKCDGLQPCMQCKARQRPCTFSKDGSIDASMETPSPVTSRPSTPPPPLPPPLPTTFTQEHVFPDINATLDILDKLNKSWPGEGREGKWEIDTSKLKHQQQNQQLEKDEIDEERHPLPNKATQLQLIQLYFNHSYALFPILPKRIFFKQFDSPIQSSYLLNPLLLFILFAHGAKQQNMKDADQYFQHAKLILAEGALNQPKLSTVIALVLMTLYESNENKNNIMYSALAFQMALDLDLMRDYSHKDDTEIFEREQVGGSDLKELRKRVCWGCYTLDKLVHVQLGQPWILRSKDIELDMPLLQPGDDVVEHSVLEGFVATIKLLQLAERALQPESLQQIGQPVIRTHAHDQMSFNLDNDLLHWLRSLPSHLQWTPIIPPSSSSSSSIPQPPTTPPSSAMACQLHVLYNLIELYILKPFSSSTVKSIQQRSVIVASNLTRLASFLSENQAWILYETFILNALFESTQLHIKVCSCENLNLARNARFMFQQSVHILKKLLPQVRTTALCNRIIRFTLALNQAINDADSNNPLFSEMNEDDIMTPFVLGSLNAKYSEEERQQWSKLDYFANGLITAPTVKSKAPSITMSSTMFVPTSSYYGHHSAITDTMFSQPPSSSTSSSSSWKQPQYVNKYQQTPSDLLQSSHPTADLAAFVAQMQDNTNSSTSSPASNNNKEWSNTSTPVLMDETTSAPNTSSIVANDNENLLYSLLSNQRSTSTPTVTAKRQYQSSYMNVGLGIYASAHQHHNDVIRQHLPNNK